LTTRWICGLGFRVRLGVGVGVVLGVGVGFVLGSDDFSAHLVIMSFIVFTRSGAMSALWIRCRSSGDTRTDDPPTRTVAM
jgi:hypothetical protein